MICASYGKADNCENKAEYFNFWKGCTYCGGADCTDYDTYEFCCSECKDSWIITGIDWKPISEYDGH